ncbi:MAG: VanZ family protein [Clostridia bacterium]|nr:VanZ family protein [Clostridia bacterium]
MKKKHLLPIRIVLGILIILNMAVIFAFSAQSGTQSSQVSHNITSGITDVIAPEVKDRTEAEQIAFMGPIHRTLRKIAHMAEFGSLGCLIFLFLLTWEKHPLIYYASSLAFTFLYACSDELHQLLSESRGAQISDVVLDICGALIACTVVLLIVWIRRTRRKGATTD